MLIFVVRVLTLIVFFQCIICLSYPKFSFANSCAPGVQCDSCGLKSSNLQNGNSAQDIVNLLTDSNIVIADRQTLQRCTREAIRKTPDNRCAEAVRTSLGCMYAGGDSFKFSCGRSAYRYHERAGVTCLKDKGFVNMIGRIDSQGLDYCERPGAIRVYKGPCSGPKWTISSCKREMERLTGRKGDYLVGDIHGHIEIKGYDGKYHHFAASEYPINSERVLGSWRRELTGCYFPTKDVVE